MHFRIIVQLPAVMNATYTSAHLEGNELRIANVRAQALFSSTLDRLELVSCCFGDSQALSLNLSTAAWAMRYQSVLCL